MDLKISRLLHSEQPSGKELQDMAEFRAVEIEAVLESVQDGMYVGDDRGIVRCNSRALELFGVSSKTELAVPIRVLAARLAARHSVTREALTESEIPFVQASREKGSVREVIIRHLQSGEDRVLRISTSPLYFRGQSTAVIATMMDVTEQHRRQNETLDALASAQQAADRLEKERAMREEFVMMLAHDLRLPLTAAKMCAQLIQRKPEIQELTQTLAGRVVENMRRADQMIRDLLDAASIRAGERLPIQLETCDLAISLREVIEDLETEHGDRFVLKAPESLPGRWCSSQLRRAVENLLTNAVKYGAAGTPITVEVHELEDELCISVHNFGSYIPDEDRARLFGTFSRSRGALASGKKGWGIGLTLVRGVAEAYGGSVQVRSDPGTGTEFTLRIPLSPRSRGLPGETGSLQASG